jgi:histidyl-tRNA synthetase
LQNFINERLEHLCEDCQRRSVTNPLRVLDCKSVHCQEQYTSAPSILQHLCGVCSAHFDEVKGGLDLLDVPYSVNSRMVRGLDYYTRTAFELITTELGAQGAIGAGGRYNGLVNQLGGPDVPGIGFAMGIERLVMLLNQKDKIEGHTGPDLFLVALGEAAYEMAFQLMQQLRSLGVRVMMDHEGRSMKNQMKQANKQKAGFVLILGENELENNEAVLKDMLSGEQERVDLAADLGKWAADIKIKIRQQ